MVFPEVKERTFSEDQRKVENVKCLRTQKLGLFPMEIANG